MILTVILATNFSRTTNLNPNYNRNVNSVVMVLAKEKQ